MTAQVRVHHSKNLTREVRSFDVQKPMYGKVDHVRTQLCDLIL
jgi:hypothetical protein